MLPRLLNNERQSLMTAEQAREIRKEIVKENSITVRCYKKLKEEVTTAILDAIYDGKDNCDIQTNVKPISKIAEDLSKELEELGYSNTFGLSNGTVFYKVSWREKENI